MKKYERIIVALDVNGLRRARDLLELLSPYVKIFKIGPRLFIPYGKKIINLVRAYNCEVFLDLKLYDIPTQVRASVNRIAKLGVRMFTVHALGGGEMLTQARKALDEFPPEERPYMLAVTLLTSLDKKDLHFLNFKNKINFLVFKLAKLALISGADGIICSAKEVKSLKQKISQNFIAVVPGIRLDSSYDDQKRVTTPGEAFKQGADYIVIGRAILNVSDPVKVLKEVIK